MCVNICMYNMYIRRPLLAAGGARQRKGDKTPGAVMLELMLELITCGFRKQSFNRSCAGGWPAARTRKQVGSWQLRKTSKNEGLQLVSSQFRKRRLARLAARSGPLPPFRDKVF